MFPNEVDSILTNYRTCEFSTLTKSNKPSIHPVTAWYQPHMDHILITTAIGFPQKIYNVKRNSKVSLLFSNPTASQVDSEGAVCIQGDAFASDGISTISDLEAFWKRMFKWQPHSKAYHRSFIGRTLFDWYFMRIQIKIYPKRILFWRTNDYTQNPQEIKLNDI